MNEEEVLLKEIAMLSKALGKPPQFFTPAPKSNQGPWKSNGPARNKSLVLNGTPKAQLPSPAPNPFAKKISLADVVFSFSKTQGPPVPAPAQSKSTQNGVVFSFSAPARPPQPLAVTPTNHLVPTRVGPGPSVPPRPIQPAPPAKPTTTSAPSIPRNVSQNKSLVLKVDTSNPSAVPMKPSLPTSTQKPVAKPGKGNMHWVRPGTAPASTTTPSAPSTLTTSPLNSSSSLPRPQAAPSPSTAPQKPPSISAHASSRTSTRGNRVLILNSRPPVSIGGSKSSASSSPLSPSTSISSSTSTASAPRAPPSGATLRKSRSAYTWIAPGVAVRSASKDLPKLSKPTATTASTSTLTGSTLKISSRPTAPAMIRLKGRNLAIVRKGVPKPKPPPPPPVLATPLPRPPLSTFSVGGVNYAKSADGRKLVIQKGKGASGGYIYVKDPLGKTLRRVSVGKPPSLSSVSSAPRRLTGFVMSKNGKSITRKGILPISKSTAITKPAGKVYKLRKTVKKSKDFCMFFNRFGKCNKGDECPFIHDKSKVAVCRAFLEGGCANPSCTLSHVRDRSKMPSCKKFLKGLCDDEDCPYSHVKVSKTAEACPDFQKGYCPRGEKCTMKHIYARKKRKEKEGGDGEMGDLGVDLNENDDDLDEGMPSSPNSDGQPNKRAKHEEPSFNILPDFVKL